MFNVRSVSRQLPPREIALLPPPLPPPIRLELGFGLGLGLLLGLGGNFSRGNCPRTCQVFLTILRVSKGKCFIRIYGKLGCQCSKNPTEAAIQSCS